VTGGFRKTESVRWLSREGWLDGKEFAKICGLGSRLAK